MKKMISLVCLFFMAIHSMNLDFENRVNVLLEKEESENIEVLSKKSNALYIEIEEAFMELNEMHAICLDKLEEYEKRLDVYTKQFQDIKIYMRLFQYGQSFSALDCYRKNGHQIQFFQKGIQEIQRCLQQQEETMEEYESYLRTLNQLQERLWMKSSYQEMKEEGKYNAHSMIQGNVDLPSYGGYVSHNHNEGLACLISQSYSIDSFSDTWILPITSGNMSAGTWSYPDGNLHLGMDFACNMYTNVMAPANGLILYADAPVSSNCGYLGNWVGWPAGGGNTVCMICAVENELYMVTFAHLSNQIYVVPGQQVSQGDVLAASGNSGNSTGPHCHIEVFRLNASLDEVITYFMQGADFSLGNGYSQANTCSQYACRIRPESVWG